MRQEEINRLSEQYTQEKGEVDRRFHSSIGADVPSAAMLTREILQDLDPDTLGISWWGATPILERILIGDYLHQCVTGIDVNLVEARLHFLEWLDAREQGQKRIADVLYKDNFGNLGIKMPPSKNPLDDLPNKLESLHLCGFFRAIGSSLDCLGAVIIGVLGLPVSLRRADINKAQIALSKIVPSASSGSKLQFDFQAFFETIKTSSGPVDWLEWADQYRNMFVHRGRRTITNQIVPKDVLLVDANGATIPRATTTLHLAKFPGRSDAEAFIKSKNFLLNEDAEITLSGAFKSCREVQELACERLLSIWKDRRNNPSLIEQPASQWDDKFNPCNFDGYSLPSIPFDSDRIIGNPSLFRRMLSASVDDGHRSLWSGSKWE